jgi:hypothetical protein
LPITPFHFGPGALFKAAAPRYFSWTIFALSNVVIDLEPISLFFLIGDPAHPWLHTLPGAISVAAIVAMFGREFCERALRWWNQQLASGWQARWLAVDPTITKTAAWVSAVVGTLSHIALDSIMHTDVEALWPIVAGNHVQGVLSLDVLHGICIVAALLALAIWIVAKRTGQHRHHTERGDC